MIVPRTRLLLWISLIVLPFAARRGDDAGRARAFRASSSARLFAAVIVDAFLARGRLAGIRVRTAGGRPLAKGSPGHARGAHSQRIARPRACCASASLFRAKSPRTTDDRTVLLPADAATLAARLAGHAEPARPVFSRARLSRSRFAAGLLGGAREPAGARGIARVSESFRRAEKRRRALPAPRRPRHPRAAPGGAGARF